MDIFYFNFSFFVKKTLQKEITDFDNAIFIELEQLIYNLKNENLNNGNYISIREHHQILNRLNIKVNQFDETNRLLQ